MVEWNRSIERCNMARKKIVVDCKEEREKEDKFLKKESIREVIIEKKTGFNYLEVILIMIITLIIGAFLGGLVLRLTAKDTSCAKEKFETSQYREFIETYNNIKKNYYEEIDEDALLDAGIKGMLDFLGDQYSVYMNPEETDDFNEQVEGKYQGIGVEIVQSDNQEISIHRIFEGTPAEKAGLKVGDIIKRVGDVDVSQKDISEVSDMIKKSDKKTVVVVVSRDGEEKEFTLSRDNIDIESVIAKTFERDDKKIGYLSLSIFASNTEKQFQKKLLELEKEGIDGLIIDVRGNSGGYLNSVTAIASMFLEKGKMIYQLDTKGIVEPIRDQSKEKRKYPVAILINKGSASASEILAGALHESYGAYLVGTSSYGKGTVQVAYTLESGATVKYTIQKWLTPDGNWVNEKGLTPTHMEEMNIEYYANPEEENDNQLQKALELVTQ